MLCRLDNIATRGMLNPTLKANRLDVEMVARGLAESREQAQRFILAGEVWVEGQRWDKASKPCAAGMKLEVRGQERYVGRGGHKLEGALTGFFLDVAGLRCLDIGASTGGFTDCLLQHGAREVVAVDVGKGQLHWKLRNDPRVVVYEGLNARDLDCLKPDQMNFDLAVADVSFISLRLVLPAAFDLLHSGGRVVALIKPQFEAGREEVGKGGIVRDAAVRQRVVDSLVRWLGDFPLLRSVGVIPSPLPGRDGNEEFLWLLQKI